ncbi:hypothetical protein VAE032_271532 [Vibrio aestuarianus]|nr:hypothetical protein VAE032_271532 [Vibrio aestuarianus]
MLTLNAKNLLIPPVARIAQSVEQRIENPRVGGSIPPPGTTVSKLLVLSTDNKIKENMCRLSSVGRATDL